MKLISYFQKNVMLPAFDLIQGSDIASTLDFLLRSQNWSQDELLFYQEQKLKSVIEHAYNWVPFYKDLFRKHNLVPEDMKSLEDLKKLPIISKDDLRSKNREYIISGKTNNLIRMNSSGSTGEPFTYYLSRNAYSMKYAAAIRGWMWMGYRLGDKYAKLSQNERITGIKKIQDFINRCVYIYINDLSNTGIKNTISILEKEKPLYIRCYPDPLYFMALVLKKMGKKITGLKGINTTGNILFPEARETIEEYFGCPVFDSYSCEGGALFYQEAERNTYLGSSEYAFTEIVDSSGNDVSPGNPGFHITTDLQNYGMPMIRYNTQDMIESSAESYYASALFNIQRVIGRDNDILVTPDGNLLIVHLFTIYFEYFPSIRQFQVEQTDSHEFIFRLVVDESFDNKTRTDIYEYWQKYLGKNVRLLIELHDNINLLYSGKRRFLIRNPEIELFSGIK